MLQVVIKLAEHNISVGALSALRFGIAALCFAPSAVRGLRNKEMRLTALELGLWLFGARHPQIQIPAMPLQANRIVLMPCNQHCRIVMVAWH